MVSNLSEQDIEEVLKDNVWAILGCNDGFNTYIYPTNFLYDGKSILCHSQIGFKLIVMRKSTRVCLQVDEVEKHKNWRSVMVLGEYQEVNDEQERHDAMKAFDARRLFLKISDSTLHATNEKNDQVDLMKVSEPIIYRIVVDEKTGCYEND